MSECTCREDELGCKPSCSCVRCGCNERTYKELRARRIVLLRDLRSEGYDVSFEGEGCVLY